MSRARIRNALAWVLLAMRPGERVIPAARLAAALGISQAAAWRDIHAAAQAAGVRLWHAREFRALVRL